VQTYRKQVSFDQYIAVRMLVRSPHRDIGTPAASQYWPLQLTLLAIALTLAAALLASGWYATRTRAI
jgi:hypothetical protein